MGLGMAPAIPTTSAPLLPRLKQFGYPSIDIPSFSAFQTHPSSASGSNTPSPVKRKPLPASASPILTRVPLSSGGRIIAIGDEELTDQRSTSSFPERTSSRRSQHLPTPPTHSPPLVIRDLDQFPHGHTPLVTPTPRTGAFSAVDSSIQRKPVHSPITTAPPPTRIPNHARIASDSVLHETKVDKSADGDGLQRAATMSLRLGVRPNALHITSDQRSFSDHEGQDQSAITRTPRSPGPNKISSFFGWKTSSPIAEVSPSTFSNRSHSPNHSPNRSPFPSPLLPSPHSLAPSPRSKPQDIDITRASADMNATYFAEMGFPMPPRAGPASGQLDAMEEELREVSSELAGSIRRELELEDLVDRLQLEAQQGPELSRRTSDYFSDSGTSSVRYPFSEADGTKTEDVAKLKRISEQEKAQLRLNMSQKLQNERASRKVLELHIQQLGQQVQNMDEERARSSSVASRIRELEGTLEDVRRQLLEERRGKENFEDLLTALRGEIQQYRDDRDNLRDKVVPQLRFQLEKKGESSDHQKLTNDNLRLQQELQSLRNENTTLMNARRLQLDMQQHSPGFNSIAEEDDGPSPLSPALTVGLTRSNSVARMNAKGGLSRASSLKRSNSISAKERESRDSLADRVKDIEMQRDALHQALRSLLDRQAYQHNEHNKKLRALEVERDRALQNHSPRRLGYEREVTSLRDEIQHLRRRADDAFRQKWQCEKGLGGLKMDLDRAEQETSSLRILLQEHDILIPELSRRPSQEIQHGTHATSASLEKAYRELRATQALSVSKLRELRRQAPSSAEDENTARTLDLLLKSMSDAEAERDHAQKQAESYRAQADSLQDSEAFQTGETAGLVEQLRASASRVEGLALQVRNQLESNRDLRERLAEAVGRGEREQTKSASRINSMQGKLKSLEDKLMTAQQHSEETFAQHEEEVREIQESHNLQLQRLKGGLRTPTIFAPKSPLSPMFSPRLNKTTSGYGISMTEAVKTDSLERKVSELEGALGDADKEMEEVISRMNRAQIEVLELQTARDEAMRQTRKLQTAINAEREKVDALMEVSDTLWTSTAPQDHVHI